MDAAIVIDGYALHWTLQREPHWSTDGYKGLAICVRSSEGTFRDLLLEFPYPKRKPGYVRHPDRPRIVPGVIEAAIRAAMAAGWNPTSRGRVFAFPVPEE